MQRNNVRITFTFLKMFKCRLFCYATICTSDTTIGIYELKIEKPNYLSPESVDGY